MLATNDKGFKDEVWKAGFVVPGYKDKLTTSLAHDTATLRFNITTGARGG